MFGKTLSPRRIYTQEGRSPPLNVLKQSKAKPAKSKIEQQKDAGNTKKNERLRLGFYSLVQQGKIFNPTIFYNP